jgi:tRNA threonylcarbamoyladenosine biosynthesis protein TsaE
VIVNEYRHPELGILFHVDAYRLADSTDAEMLDLDAMLIRGVLVVEWAERVKAVLPADNLWVKMKWTSAEQRYMHFLGSRIRHETLSNQLKQSIFVGD